VFEDDQMLDLIRANTRAADLLAGYFEFDMDLGEPVEELRLASGGELEPIAGEGAGGCYFLSRTGNFRPVLFASSEGEGGRIAASLREALQLIIGMPYWRDCLKFAAGGSLGEMRLAATHLEHDLLEKDDPEVARTRDELREVLGLPETSADDLLTKLHRAASSTEPDSVLVESHGHGYGSLFNSFHVADNPGWR
jgi:hypothetical protein